MPEDEIFFITYKGSQVKVTSVINGGNIYFIFHFKVPVIVAEGFVDEAWVWYEVDKGQTVLSGELGEILEMMDI